MISEVRIASYMCIHDRENVLEMQRKLQVLRLKSSPNLVYSCGSSDVAGSVCGRGRGRRTDHIPDSHQATSNVKPRQKNSSFGPPTATPPGKDKRRIFGIVLVAFPVLIVVGMEVALRLAGYGGNLNLVVKTSIGGKEFYSINRYVATRYFSGGGTTIPEPSEDTFEIRKGARTKRIFCLGESTMAGFPYEFHATAPAFLKDRLSVLLPDYNIEVINVGVSAVSSFVVKDFMDELAAYEPDLYIVYVGHNEFYGAYGVGSTVAIRGGAWLTRLTISLLKFRMFLLLRDGYTWLRQSFSSGASTLSGSLMGQMVGEQTIPYGGELYQQARRIYQENLERIISSARSQNVPVLFSALVSNIKTQRPFVPTFDPRTEEHQRQEWNRLVTEGNALFAQGNAHAAIERYRMAITIDSTNAEGHFNIGQALYSSGKYEEARIAFLRAKDFDALRFRASEEFVSDLAGVTKRMQVPLAAVDSAFEAGSEHGIPGNELILEHIHPTLDGYFLMAKVFASSIYKNNLLAPESEWNLAEDKSDEEYMNMSTVSAFDHAVGRIKVELLMRRWPFTTGQTDFKFTPADAVESIAFAYLQKRIPWSDARYKLAEVYAEGKNYEEARTECLAVARVLSSSYQPLLKVADYYRDEGRNEEAKAGYLRCIETEENPFCRMKLSLVLLEEENLPAAEKQITLAIAVDQRGPHKMTPEASASARYLLGVAQAKQGKYRHAEESLNQALALKPGFEEARQLLGQITRLTRPQN